MAQFKVTIKGVKGRSTDSVFTIPAPDINDAVEWGKRQAMQMGVQTKIEVEEIEAPVPDPNEETKELEVKPKKHKRSKKEKKDEPSDG